MVVISAKARVWILFLAVFFVVNVMLPTVLAQRCVPCRRDSDCPNTPLLIIPTCQHGNNGWCCYPSRWFIVLTAYDPQHYCTQNLDQRAYYSFQWLYSNFNILMHTYPGVSFSNTNDISSWVNVYNLKYRSKKNQWHTFRYTIFEKINNAQSWFYSILHSRLMIGQCKIFRYNLLYFRPKMSTKTW